MKIIDLRSDTITLPTEEMRQAMYQAELGDDVYREDPTVNRLEELAANMVGKEAALFTSSGTMANLIAILTHTRPGDEILIGSEGHIFWYEVGGAAALGLGVRSDGVSAAAAAEFSDGGQFSCASVAEDAPARRVQRIAAAGAYPRAHEVGQRQTEAERALRKRFAHPIPRPPA